MSITFRNTGLYSGKHGDTLPSWVQNDIRWCPPLLVRMRERRRRNFFADPTVQAFWSAPSTIEIQVGNYRNFLELFTSVRTSWLWVCSDRRHLPLQMSALLLPWYYYQIQRLAASPWLCRCRFLPFFSSTLIFTKPSFPHRTYWIHLTFAAFDVLNASWL